ncbi:hypothetical protein Pmani_017298 [Petrolisthes manimaculis]|uniref:Uncharacterized protein n=1 Tax=Petrolisthes manimaculis TaxID=1843537 RepID=A0AAE1UA16_9EUCA|nr:hypothetical protein Pmani_017298 [Petrolisthes manimaculis]
MNRPQQQQPLRSSPLTVTPRPVPIFPQAPRPVIRPSPPRPTPAVPRRPQRAISVQVTRPITKPRRRPRRQRQPRRLPCCPCYCVEECCESPDDNS